MRALLALGFALSACASFPPDEVTGDMPATPDVEGIDYETGTCFGRCPVYRIAFNADGSGLFEGRHGSAHQGERSLRISRAEYRAFAARLAPYRPRGDDISYSGPPLCAQMATDMPSVTVTWHWPNRRPQRLHFYYGCDMARYREMAEQLRSATSLLPVGDLIGAPH